MAELSMKWLVPAVAIAASACTSTPVGTASSSTPPPQTTGPSAGNTMTAQTTAGTTPPSAGVTGTAGTRETAAGTMSAPSGGGGGAAGGGGKLADAGAGGSAGVQSGMAGNPAVAGDAGTLGMPLTYTGTFTMGMTIPTENKCPMSAVGGGTGENKSPALSWKGGPVDTKSFAIVLYDTKYNMLHWVLWDIPSSVSELPEGLPAGFELSNPMGAHQAASMGTNPHAYYGPCSSGALAGTYEFRLYALNAAKLSLTESATGAQAQSAVESSKLEMTVWSGKPM